MIVCIHEDRTDHVLGIRLLVLSLLRWWPDVRVVVSGPDPGSESMAWARPLRAVTIMESGGLGPGLGVNVKPSALLRCLADGFDDVVWIDSDVIVAGDPRPILLGLAPDVLVATEETAWGQRQGSAVRTRAWGLEPGRSLPRTVNTGVVRVTGRHTELLEAWRRLLQHPLYLEAMDRAWSDRPVHMLGDQDVLTALLGGRPFADVPIRLLVRGEEIAQCFGPAGFTPGERLRSLRRGCPTFIHSMGAKPWQRPATTAAIWRSRTPIAARLRRYYEFVHLDVSPFTIEARRYGDDLGGDGACLRVRSIPGRVLGAVVRSAPAQELPLAAFDSAVRHARRRLGVDRIGLDPTFCLATSPL